MIRRRQVRVEIHQDVVDELTRAVRAAGPSEIGGLLLGWWNGGDVIARYAVEVLDPTATQYSWIRSPEPAQDALDRALTLFDHPWLGYVGDWHSHPVPVGASGQDLESIRRASKQYAKPLILVVQHRDRVQDIHSAVRGSLRGVDLSVRHQGEEHLAQR